MSMGLWILALTATTTGVTRATAVPAGLVWRADTRHFTFYARPDEKTDTVACERYASELVRLFGHPKLMRACYFRYRDAQELAAGTGTYAVGLTYSEAREIHSTKAFHAHEIVHLVAGQLGRPGAFFQEGLAVALADKGRWRGRDVDAWAREDARGRSVRWMVQHFERLDAEVAYPLAGSFVKALLHTYGAARIAELFRQCAQGLTLGAFEQTFGQTLEAADHAWHARLRPRGTGGQPPVLGRPEPPEGGTPWSRR